MCLRLMLAYQEEGTITRNQSSQLTVNVYWITSENVNIHVVGFVKVVICSFSFNFLNKYKIYFE